MQTGLKRVIQPKDRSKNMFETIVLAQVIITVTAGVLAVRQAWKDAVKRNQH
jgi:hypothetical protein